MAVIRVPTLVGACVGHRSLPVEVVSGVEPGAEPLCRARVAWCDAWVGVLTGRDP